MGEVEYERQQVRTKEGAFVVPLDSLRSIQYATKTFISGEFPGSGIFPVASGKVAYLKEFIVTNKSGIYPVELIWADAATAQSGFQISGNAYAVDYIISSGQALGGSFIVKLEPALGPYVSGIVMVSGGSQLGGTVTAVIQIDPQPYE